MSNVRKDSQWSTEIRFYQDQGLWCKIPTQIHLQKVVVTSPFQGYLSTKSNQFELCKDSDVIND